MTEDFNMTSFAKSQLESYSNEHLNKCEENELQNLLMIAITCDRNQTIRLLNYVKDVDCGLVSYINDCPTRKVIEFDELGYGDDYELIELFLKKGASIGIDSGKKNLLYHALIAKKYEIAKVIIKNAKSMESLLIQERNVITYNEPLILIIDSQNLDLIRTFARCMDFGLVKGNYFYYKEILASAIIRQKYTSIKIFIRFGLDLEDAYNNFLNKTFYKDINEIFKKEKENIKNQLKEEYEVLNLILLGHYKDENSFFSFIPLEIIEDIILKTDLRYPRRTNPSSIKKIKFDEI